MMSLMALLEYLTESAVSPLQANFVEIEDPYASSASYTFIENSEACMYLEFSGVPVAKLGYVEEKLTKVLGDIVSGEIAWDASRMQTVLNKRIQEQISQIENAPHDSVASMVIGDVLYGTSDNDFDARLNSVSVYRDMQARESNFWIDLLQKYFVDKPRVLVQGKPLKQLEADMKAAEKKRIAEQVEKLGEAGLKEKAEILEKAMEKNDEEAPEEVLSAVPIPSADSISLHSVQSYISNDSSKPCPHFDINQMPMFTKFNQINSQFVYFHVVINTSGIKSDLKMYLPLLLEIIGEAAVVDNDGNEISYENVVAQLEKDFVAKTFSIGLSGGRFKPGAFPSAAVMYFQVLFFFRERDREMGCLLH